MKLLDERGIGTVWSICKEKFALAGHTHNYAGSGSTGGSANSAIGVVDYGQTDKTIQIGYSGTGITGDQIKYIAGYTDGSGNVNAKIKDVSKDALRAWLGLGSLAYSSSSIPTNLSQLNNDKGFVTGSVSGNTVTINGASTTWTNTWRGIQDNLTSNSTSDSLSANQGRILKNLVDGKANSNEVIKFVRVQLYGDTINGFTPTIVVTDNANKEYSFTINKANGNTNGLMSIKDKNKLDLIADRANNYTLPVASSSTLGGIKVSGNVDENCWPICVDGNGLAQTKIPGLLKHNNRLYSVMLSNEVNSTYYNINGISTEDKASKKRADISLPLKSGTFALTSDLSDLCKFNFANSVSECKSDRINFLLRCTDTLIDLAPFDSYPDGTILLITTNDNTSEIRHQSGRWYSCGNSVSISYSAYAYKEEINLITKNNGIVHHYKFN